MSHTRITGLKNVSERDHETTQSRMCTYIAEPRAKLTWDELRLAPMPTVLQNEPFILEPHREWSKAPTAF